jgi:hypothetical protein
MYKQYIFFSAYFSHKPIVCVVKSFFPQTSVDYFRNYQYNEPNVFHRTISVWYGTNS